MDIWYIISKKSHFGPTQKKDTVGSKGHNHYGVVDASVKQSLVEFCNDNIFYTVNMHCMFQFQEENAFMKYMK